MQGILSESDALKAFDGWCAPRPEGPGSRVVAIGGDGIGPEVNDVAVAVLRATGAPITIETPLSGEAAVKAGAPAFGPDVQAACRKADAVLFGACDKVSTPILRWLRFELDAYANLRPSSALPHLPVRLQRGQDLVIVRELSEGLYPGREGSLADLAARWPEYKDSQQRGWATDGKFAVRQTTPAAVTRIAKVAAALALHRKARGLGRGKITIVTKANVLPQTDGLFHAGCVEIFKQHGELTVDHLFVDEAARRLVAIPESFDVIVTSNLFGDILSDVAAEGVGGLPLAPSASLGDGHAHFEPVHGSAPDIAGKGIANPLGAVLAGAMMLRHLGHATHAVKLVEAVLAIAKDGVRPRDLGGDAGTKQVGDALLKRLG